MQAHHDKTRIDPRFERSYLAPAAFTLSTVMMLLSGCAAEEPSPAPQIDPPMAPPPADTSFTPPPRGTLPDGDFGEAVSRGEAIFHDSPTHAGEYAGNHLSCKNCHLDDGRRADAAPMWAAWVSYPAFRKKNRHVNTMEERIQGCFTYSLNARESVVGHAPESGSLVLSDLQSYMYWLSTGAKVGDDLPGRGFPKLDKPEGGWDRDRGGKLYAEKCSACHGASGEGVEAAGTLFFPPLWGPESYNWGAGMHRISTAAGFIYANMPLGQERTLSEQEAWDLAAFVNSHPRPADPRRAIAGPETDATFHEHPCSYGDEVDGDVLGAGSRP